ncbi:MAG: peptidylprolyl isomerase [Candidatus Baltobacteraceae bacterium]|jgi:foldase protein PrsA
MPNAIRVTLGCAAAVLGLALAACSSATAGGGGDVASVNGTSISRTDFDARLESGPQGKQVLNQMVQGLLIDQYAKDNNLTIADADIQQKEDEIKAKYPPGQFEAILKAQNLSEDDVKRILRQQLVIEKAVSSTVHVSDADVQNYLKANHASLDTGEQVRARHILVSDLKTAELVESKLKAGASFEDLAKQYSTDPSSKDKGGELGFFSKGQMVPAFEQAAFTQEVNTVGPPVKSPFGYHIIEVEERKPAQVATLANSSDKIRKLLTQQQEQQQIPQFLAGLRQKANIQIFDDRLKDALPPIPVPAAAASAAAPAPTK